MEESRRQNKTQKLERVWEAGSWAVGSEMRSSLSGDSPRELSLGG